MAESMADSPESASAALVITVESADGERIRYIRTDAGKSWRASTRRGASTFSSASVLFEVAAAILSENDRSQT
jgi:hypothetical protein